eukprot:415059_1
MSSMKSDKQRPLQSRSAKRQRLSSDADDYAEINHSDHETVTSVKKKGLDDDENQSENLAISFNNLVSAQSPPNHESIGQLPASASSGFWSSKLSSHYRKCHVHFESAASGSYEQLPVCRIDKLDLNLRWYPNGHTIESSNTAIGITLGNKEELLHRLTCKTNEDVTITIQIQLGGHDEIVSFQLREFVNSFIIFKSLGFNQSLWKKHKNISFEIVLKSNFIEAIYIKDTAQGIRCYEANKQYGSLKIYSCDSNAYRPGDSIFVSGLANWNKENVNSNNSNNKQMSVMNGNLSGGYIRIERAQFAALGKAFENMICGKYANDLEIVINAPLLQINCMLWYSCNAELHPASDPVWFAALAHYLCNVPLKKKALNMCYFKLELQSLPRFCALYTELEVSLKDGLHLLVLYIKQYLKQIKEKDAFTGRSVYDDIRDIKFVMNHI